MKLVTAIAVVAILGAEIARSATSPQVVLLGDDARVALVKHCGASCVSGSTTVGSPSLNSSATEVASFSQHAKHAIIVVDAAQGPLPITREHVQVARQAGVPSLSIMFVNMAGLEGMQDAAELIELEELEVRELMNTYEMHGDSAMVFHDAQLRSISQLHTNGVGLANALKAVTAIPPKKPDESRHQPCNRIASFLYVLSRQESAKSITLRQGAQVKLWVNGQVVNAVVTSAQALKPGDNGELSLELLSIATASKGSRFLIEREGRIVAMGVVVRTSS